MEKVKKLHEKKRMEGRRLNEAEIEAENEEDWKATLWYDLEKEIRGTFRYFLKEITVIELKYEKAGLSWEEIREVRKGILNGKN